MWSLITCFSKALAGLSVYSATKGAVEQFSHVLSQELASRGITVNTVSPGPIATEILGPDLEAAKKTYASFSPFGLL